MERKTKAATQTGLYLLIVALLSTAAVLVIRERKGIDLGINNQAEQEAGATIFDRSRIPATETAKADAKV